MNGNEPFERHLVNPKYGDLLVMRYIVTERKNISTHLPYRNFEVAVHSNVRRLLSWGVLERTANRRNVPGWYSLTGYGHFYLRAFEDYIESHCINLISELFKISRNGKQPPPANCSGIKW